MNCKDDPPRIYIARKKQLHTSNSHQPPRFYPALNCRTKNDGSFLFEVKILCDFGKEFECSYANLDRYFHGLRVITINQFNNIPFELLTPLATKVWNIDDLIDENPWFAIGLLDQSGEIKNQLLIANIQMRGQMYPKGGFVPKPFFQPDFYALVKEKLPNTKISANKRDHSPEDFIDIEFINDQVIVKFPTDLGSFLSRRQILSIEDFQEHLETSKHLIANQLGYKNPIVERIQNNILHKKIDFLKDIAEGTEEYGQNFKI